MKGNTMHKLPVLAVDVGFGNTKYKYGDQDNDSGIFKSVAAKAILDDKSFETVSPTMNRIAVTVNQKEYIVGPEAYELDKTVEMADDFVATEAYLALIKGAIYYSMKALSTPFDTIEALAVGLPNSNFVRDKQILKDVLLTTHTIPVPSKFSHLMGPTIDVKIEKILTLPQPLGSQTAYLMQQQIYETKNQTNLVIDIGFNTLDWLSIKTVSIDSSHSGSINAGVSQVLQALSSYISKLHGIERLEFYDTQKAYLDGFFIYKGRKILTNQLQSIVENKCDDIVNRFKNNIKKYDYDNLILTGGGAQMYASSIHKQFKDLNVITLADPVFANVLGFYFYAKNLKQA